MISKEKLEALCAGGYSVFFYHSQSGLWTVSRSHCTGTKGISRSHKASSFDLELAVKELEAEAERRVLVATSNGVLA